MEIETPKIRVGIKEITPLWNICEKLNNTKDKFSDDNLEIKMEIMSFVQDMVQEAFEMGIDYSEKINNA